MKLAILSACLSFSLALRDGILPLDSKCHRRRIVFRKRCQPQLECDFTVNPIWGVCKAREGVDCKNSSGCKHGLYCNRGKCSVGKLGKGKGFNGIGAGISWSTIVDNNNDFNSDENNNDFNSNDNNDDFTWDGGMDEFTASPDHFNPTATTDCTETPITTEDCTETPTRYVQPTLL